jgi:hypothetical protein
LICCFTILLRTPLNETTQIEHLHVCKYDDLVKSASSFSVHCPVGTLYNVIHQDCQSCPQGSYQPVEGQVTCLVCPDHTSTSNNNSKSRNDCKGKTTTLVCSSLSIFTIYSYLLVTSSKDYVFLRFSFSVSTLTCMCL